MYRFYNFWKQLEPKKHKNLVYFDRDTNFRLGFSSIAQKLCTRTSNKSDFCFFWVKITFFTELTKLDTSKCYRFFVICKYLGPLTTLLLSFPNKCHSEITQNVIFLWSVHLSVFPETYRKKIISKIYVHLSVCVLNCTYIL